MQNEEVIVQILQLEWTMFTGVQNVGGTAGCQNDSDTFTIMRGSQAMTWPAELLASYHADLVAAVQAGRNLMTEKYARMMESTHPEEFAAIAPALPALDPVARGQIDEIVAINVGWEQELAGKHPRLGARGRPLRTCDDTPHATSFETYMRGELQTYSPGTIALYHAHTLNQLAAGINGAELVMQNMIEAYGYTSIAEANARV